MKKDKIGLLFGSFDPIHNGHLLVAEIAQSRSNLNEIWFVVTPQNPLKQSPLLETIDRINLVSESISYNEKFKVCNIELQMQEPIYTYNTLNVLRKQYPDVEFYYIMGSDCLDNLKNWKNVEDILEHHKIICYPRDNIQRKLPIIINGKVANVFFLNASPVTISSTQIRKEKELKKIKNLLPKPVFKFLQEIKLNQKDNI